MLKILRALGFSFSLKRALGFTALRLKLSRFIGIPTTKDGMFRKVGRTIFSIFK